VNKEEEAYCHKGWKAPKEQKKKKNIVTKTGRLQGVRKNRVFFYIVSGFYFFILL